MNDIPTLRIDLQGVSYHVQHAFTDKMDEIKDYACKTIDAAIKTLVENGGLERAIVETVQHTMTNAIDRGIRDAVNDTIYDFFYSGEGKEFVVQAIMEGLKPTLRANVKDE